MKAYKLAEIAIKENKHYQTILKNKKNYVEIQIDRGQRKPLKRFLDLETSQKIKALFPNE